MKRRCFYYCTYRRRNTFKCNNATNHPDQIINQAWPFVWPTPVGQTVQSAITNVWFTTNTNTSHWLLELAGGGWPWGRSWTPSRTGLTLNMWGPVVITNGHFYNHSLQRNRIEPWFSTRGESSPRGQWSPFRGHELTTALKNKYYRRHWKQ